MSNAASSLNEFLKTQLCFDAVPFEILENDDFDTTPRQKIIYRSRDGDSIPAYLWTPKQKGRHPAILVHHQHAGQQHFGKSEVAGIVGDPLQAFGPALAEKGFVVLAPDSICFEDRRKNKQGTQPDEGEKDWLQQFNEMTYRLINGDTLMRKVLDDASTGLSLLYNLPMVDQKRVGCLGHSYGGNTTIFQTALDDRIAFACSSGAVCSYKKKIEDDISLEMALAVPNIANKWDIDKIVSAIAPRPFLIVSSTEDPYSKDAAYIYDKALGEYAAQNAQSQLQHVQYPGKHALTQERFDKIVEWLGQFAQGSNPALVFRLA